MLLSRFSIEKITRLKRVAMIQCGNDTKDDRGFGKSPNPTEMIKYCIENHDLLPYQKEIAYVMTSERKYSVDIEGNVVRDNLTEAQIYKFIKDLSNPVPILIVKAMAGRGITLPPVKEVMTVRIRNASSPLGSVTESPEQFKGRAKSLYVGESQDKFRSEYGSIMKVPGYQELANTYNTYEPDTTMYRESDKNHREFDACTLEMTDLQIEVCEKCGQTLQNHNILNDNFDFSEIDNIFDIKKIS